MYIRLIVLHITFLWVRFVIVPFNLFVERVLRISPSLLSFEKLLLYRSICASRVALGEVKDAIFLGQVVTAGLRIAVQKYKLVGSSQVKARTKTYVSETVRRGSNE